MNKFTEARKIQFHIARARIKKIEKELSEDLIEYTLIYNFMYKFLTPKDKQILQDSYTKTNQDKVQMLKQRYKSPRNNIKYSLNCNVINR
jgi:hypothetical protein